MEIRDEIIEEVKAFHDEYGTIKMKDYEDNGKYSVHHIRKNFGTWNNLLKEAGIELNVIFNATKEDVKEDMLRLYKEHGKLTTRIQRKHSKYSQAIIDRLFGSFGQMMNELNIKETKIQKRYTDDELLDKLVALQKEHGYIDSTLVESCLDVSIQTYVYRFKTIPLAVQKAGLKYGRINSASIQSQKVINRITHILNETPHIEFTFDWLRNDKTNMPLAVDAYYPEANLIVEYHGDYHYKDVPHLQSKQTLEERQRIDKLKETLIREKGYHFLVFPHYESKSFENVFNLLRKETNFMVVT